MGQALSYRDLEVWQRAMDLVMQVYQATEGFPHHEVFNLTQQMRRAAVSIPSNIAEGHGRTRGTFTQFLDIALGSTAELDTLMTIAHRLGYLSEETYQALNEEILLIRKLLFALRKAIKGGR